MATKKKNTWGGARKGAGRKAKDEPSKVLSFRVLEKDAEFLHQRIKEIIKEYKNQQ